MDSLLHGKSIISSVCSLTPVIFLTHLAFVCALSETSCVFSTAGDAPKCTQHFLWVWPCILRSSLVLAAPLQWVTCFSYSQSHKALWNGPWVALSIAVEFSSPSYFFFKKWFSDGVHSKKHYNWAAWGMWESLAMASVAILRRGKAGYPHWEMTALVSSWGRACGSLPAFGGESEHTMFIS